MFCPLPPWHPPLSFFLFKKKKNTVGVGGWRSPGQDSAASETSALGGPPPGTATIRLSQHRTSLAHPSDFSALAVPAWTVYRRVGVGGSQRVRRGPPHLRPNPRWGGSLGKTHSFPEGPATWTPALELEAGNVGRGGLVPSRKQALPWWPSPLPPAGRSCLDPFMGEGAEVFFIYVYIFFFKL